jgi:hypothetical protein
VPTTGLGGDSRTETTTPKKFAAKLASFGREDLPRKLASFGRQDVPGKLGSFG